MFRCQTSSEKTALRDITRRFKYFNWFRIWRPERKVAYGLKITINEDASFLIPSNSELIITILIRWLSPEMVYLPTYKECGKGLADVGEQDYMARRQPSSCHYVTSWPVKLLDTKLKLATSDAILTWNLAPQTSLGYKEAHREDTEDVHSRWKTLGLFGSDPCDKEIYSKAKRVKLSPRLSTLLKR